MHNGMVAKKCRTGSSTKLSDDESYLCCGSEYCARSLGGEQNGSIHLHAFSPAASQEQLFRELSCFFFLIFCNLACFSHKFATCGRPYLIGELARTHNERKEHTLHHRQLTCRRTVSPLKLSVLFLIFYSFRPFLLLDLSGGVYAAGRSHAITCV
jgi:hypothetical protein